MPHVRSSAAFFLILLIALAGSTRETPTQTSPAPEYGVTDLGTLGGATSAALAMHPEPFSEVVGYSQTPGGAVHAFAFNGTIRDIGTLGGTNSEAWATGGFIVGRAQVGTGAYHAFRNNRFPNQMVDLGTLGGTQSYATGVNTAGDIVGASLLAGDSATRAFIVPFPATSMTALAATLGGANTVANAINDAGHVVGRADLPGGSPHHAFRYANGTTTDLGTLGTNSEAYAINDAGIIVGRSQIAGGAQHAFRYEAGVMQDLGTLGGAASEAHAINRDGAIVGWAQTSAGARRAFLWRDGTMTNLNVLIPAGTGWVLEAATGIASTGAIVGYGIRGGQRRAFMLTGPVDLTITSLQYHGDVYWDTNIPNPHEAGQTIPLGVSIAVTPGTEHPPYPSTNVTVVDTLTGPAEYVQGSLDSRCRQDGPQQLTCRLPYFEFEAHVFFSMRSTGPGQILHSARVVVADQPDPNPSNNSASQTNTAISIASLTLTPTTVVGGKNSLGRVTLTSPCNAGGARVTLSSSRPDIAAVPYPFDVLPWSGGGLWREFYVRTTAVNAPVTVQISATYGLATKTVALTIVPAAVTQKPFGGTARAVPGTIQAEDFDEGGEGIAYHDTGTGNSGSAYRSTDVDLQATRDATGAVNVGWIAAGEWLEYTISVVTRGTYTLAARVASAGAGGTFHVEVNGLNKTGSMTVPNTGGWQIWTTISRNVTLDSGPQVLRVAFDTDGATGAVGNLNYLRFALIAPGAPTPYGGTPRSVPGTIQAEDFDEGGEAVAYHDITLVNSGGQYRQTGVDIERTRDTAGAYNVGWMAASEWLNYTVNVSTAGTYVLTARVSAYGAGGTFHVEAGGVDVSGPLTIPNTGGWQAWTDVTANVTLAAGVQSIRFVADRSGATGVFGNLNYLKLERVTSTSAKAVLAARLSPELGP